MTPIVVPLQSKRRKRGELLQKLQHALPAGPLLMHGTRALGSGAHGFELALAIVEVVTSALLLVSVVREFRGLRRGHRAGGHADHGVDWAHIWAAGVIVAEIGEEWHLKHHLNRPMILTAIFTLGLGLFHERIAHGRQRRRSLRVDESGVEVSRFPRTTFRSTWTDMAAVEIAERKARLVARDGRVHTMNLADLENAGDVRRALEAARSRLGTGARPSA